MVGSEEIFGCPVQAELTVFLGSDSGRNILEDKSFDVYKVKLDNILFELDM